MLPPRQPFALALPDDLQDPADLTVRVATHPLDGNRAQPHLGETSIPHDVDVWSLVAVAHTEPEDEPLLSP